MLGQTAKTCKKISLIRIFVYKSMLGRMTERENQKHNNHFKVPGHWSKGLQTSMEDPDLKVDESKRCVIIKDKYPKALYHFLVLPKEKVNNLKSLKREHIDLLKHMQSKGMEIARIADKGLQFRFGYHAVPSMGHLHLHVISQDFNSICLKTKKHWNSFTTDYFIDSEKIIRELEKKGKIEIDTSRFETLLTQELRCHRCNKNFTTMPALKSHISLHDVSNVR